MFEETKTTTEYASPVVESKMREYWDIKIEEATLRLKNRQNEPTLRDLFAMAALSSLTTGGWGPKARIAYQMADMMLVAREEEEEEEEGDY